MVISSLTNLKLASKTMRFSHQRNKISPIIFVVLSIWDMVFLTSIYVPPSVGSIELSKGLLFLEMLVYETTPSFMLLVPFWQKTQTGAGPPTGAQINHLLWFYVFIPTFTMVLFIVISTQVFFKPIFLYLINFYLLPQIIYNFRRGNPAPFEPSTVALIVSVRPLYLLYLKGYSGNIFQISTSLILVLFMIMAVIAQIFILKMQGNHGARFFIPRERLFSWHNYLENNSLDSSGTELLPMRKVCAICMEERSECPASTEIWIPEVKPLLERLNLPPGKILKTSCKHKFHAVCLIEWMFVNMKCPTCGVPLKPIE